MERRRATRWLVDPIVRIAVHHERRLPAATTIDVSSHGMLVSFDEPIGLLVGQTVVASLARRIEETVAEADDEPEWVHVVGRVTRSARGDDFRTYVAVQFDDRYRTTAAGFLDVIRSLPAPEAERLDEATAGERPRDAQLM